MKFAAGVGVGGLRSAGPRDRHRDAGEHAPLLVDDLSVNSTRGAAELGDGGHGDEAHRQNCDGPHQIGKPFRHRSLL